jgi:hypothetical protein
MNIARPTKRPLSVSKLPINTSWGTGTVSGRIGTLHMMLLDAIYDKAELIFETNEGIVGVKIDPAQLKAKMGGNSISYETIETLIQDLITCLVELTFTNKFHQRVTTYSGLIGEFKKIESEVPTHRSGTFYSDERCRYWGITFGSGWSKILNEDTMLHYPFEDILAMKNGLSQAVSKFCISHNSDTNDTILNLTTKLGSTGRVQRRTEQLEADTDEMLKIGITVQNGMVKCVRPQTANKVKRATAT